MYTNRKIPKKELGKYEGIIPPTYMEQLRVRKFYAVVISDLVGDEHIDQAIYVTYTVDDWLELVWVKYMDQDILPQVRSYLLYYVIQMEKKRSNDTLKGVFFEIHKDELEDPIQFKHAMMMAGFETRETLDNIYELSLGQINEKSQKFLAAAARQMKCIPVSSADDILRERLDAMIQEDSRPVPVGMYVNWDDYLEEESLICMKGDTPCGLMLLSRKKDYIVIDCAYVADKLALAAMSGWAYFVLRKKYGDNQKILIPIVLEKTGLLVEKIAPEAVRGEILEGIKYF